MDVDAELMYDCLMYLNLYYFSVFGSCEAIMCAAKYKSDSKETPEIGRDSVVVSVMLSAEILKLIIFKKIRDQRKVLCSIVTLLLTFVSILAVMYTFFIQHPVLKLEYILCSMMILLLASEVLFGVLQIFPCCKRTEYV